MTAPLEHEALWGLSLAEAQKRLELVGLPAVVVKSEPPRPRHPFPPEADWRVVRTRMTGLGLELIVVPAIALGSAPTAQDPPCSDSESSAG